MYFCILFVFVTVFCDGNHMHWASVGQNIMLIKRTFRKGQKNW